MGGGDLSHDQPAAQIVIDDVICKCGETAIPITTTERGCVGGEEN